MVKWYLEFLKLFYLNKHIQESAQVHVQLSELSHGENTPETNTYP